MNATKRNYTIIATNNLGERLDWMRTNSPLSLKEKVIVNTIGLSGVSTLISSGILLNGVITR